MYQRYLLLALMTLSLIIVPGHVIVFDNNDLKHSQIEPLIETRLQMEITSQTIGGTKAILEFQSTLTFSDIIAIENLGVQFARRGSSIISVGRIYSAVVQDIDSFYRLREYGLIHATSGSKQYVPSITSSIPAIRADDVWNNLQVDGQVINGSGSSVAVIDTGVSWLHPAFWKQYPAEFDFIQSGPYYYVDINDNAIPDTNEGPIRTVNGQSGSSINYATDYMYLNVGGSSAFEYTSGDRWIGGIDANHDEQIDLTSEKGVLLNISKVSILYDQYTSQVYVRDVNLTLATGIGDSVGHGTHVASTILGGQPGLTSYVGAAPGADLIIIRSPLQSAEIIDGIHFAVENDADVINMSFSSYLGFLDGTDPEDLAVTEAFLTSGILTTAAAGNLGTRNKHSRFDVESGSFNTVTLSVNNEPDYSYLSLLWRSQDRDEHVILTHSSGEPIDLGAFSDIAGHSFVVNENNLSAYVFCEISYRGMNNIIIQVSIAEHDFLDGFWEVRVTNPTGEDVWIDGYAWDGDWATTHMVFTTQIDNYHTISGPATADFAIAVSSYDEISKTITSTSSRGPRIDGAAKPEITAPGSSISAARNSVTSLWTTKSGTSMASPHVAGVFALLRQVTAGEHPWMDYSSLLNGAGGVTAHYETSQDDWGFGLCDAALSVMHLLNNSLETDSKQSDWALIEDLVTDPVNPNVSEKLDILSVKVMQQVGSLGISVLTNAISDFSGTDMLSVEWDIDSNLLTGINGADVLLNLTSGSLTVYEWNGSEYQLSSLVGSFWADAAMTVLKIENLPTVYRGSLRVATHNSTGTYLDETNSEVLDDQWLPLVESCTILPDDSSLRVDLSTFDRDSSISAREIGCSIVDGDYISLQSSTTVGAASVNVSIESNLFLTEYINSFTFNITSDSKIFYSPAVMLSSVAGGFMRISEATLDSSVVRKGLFQNDLITGEFSVDGYTLASEVQIAFHHSSGLWLNFSLLGVDGVYEFIISPAGFPTGDYDVYAIARGSSASAEMQFATLTVIEDNTLILVGAGILLAGVVLILILRKQREPRGVEL